MPCNKLWVLLVLLLAMSATAQSLYKYKGENGEWIYTDRPPDDGNVNEVRDLEIEAAGGSVKVRSLTSGREIELVATNTYYATVELRVEFSQIQGLTYSSLEQGLAWTLAPSSETSLLTLELNEDGLAPTAEYKYSFIPGDPDAAHRPNGAYRAPFAVASEFPITQAYPDTATHTTPDSYHAVDIAMPVGTDIFAARSGVVFDVASNNFRSGLDPIKDGPAANVVRIVHDDGTYAVYAHLNWNSIRVRPGDRVTRGQYIADSGNTGFSSGPHLHFAVVRNTGMAIESVPIRFEGPNSSAVVPATQRVLSAY